MGRVRNPQPVKLFVGVLTSLPELLKGVEHRLARDFGPVDLRSELFPFDSTDYYFEEMGRPLCRIFWGFERLIAPESIATVKLGTNRIEEETAGGDAPVKRPVNIDPGYLEESKIVLASTKNFYHRILVGQGIFAEVTMHYEDRIWKRLPWTFPDFRAGRYDEYFTILRRRYREQLKEQAL